MKRFAGSFLIIFLVGISISISFSGCGLSDEEEAYSVSGEVVDAEGEGIEEVVLKFSGGFGTAETDPDGKWKKTDLEGEVEITPVKEETLIFDPYTYTVSDEEAEIVFEEYLNQEDMGEIETAHEEINSFLDDLQGGEVRALEENGQDFIEEVEAIERVKWAEIVGREMVVKYEGAGEEIWQIGSYPEPEKKDNIEMLSSEIKELSDSQKAIKAGKVALIHPLYVRDSDYQTKDVPAMLEDVKAELESVGYEVDILLGDEVDLSFYFDLLDEDYNIIFFNGHGSSTSLMTGERAPGFDNFCHLELDDNLIRAWAYDGVIRTSNYDYGRFWFITDGFIDKYWSFKEKAIFFDWGCRGLQDETGKAESLNNINVEAYIAWDDIKAGAVGSFHKLALKMVAGKTLEEAFEALDDEDKISKGYYEDRQTGELVYFEGHLDFYPRGNGNIRIGGSQSNLSPIDCFSLDLEEAGTKQEIEFEYEVEALDEDNTYFTAEIKPGGDQYYKKIKETGQYEGILEYTAPEEEESKTLTISGQLTDSPEPMENHDTETIEFAVSVASGDPGEQTSHTAGGVDFNMRLAPAATFPTGTDDDGEATVDDDFWVAETQVTYELWYEVYSWATHADRGEDKYTFDNPGREGSDGDIGEEPSSKKNEPVTRVSWYDSIVWCNAISEMLGYDPVYTIDNEVLRDSEWLTDQDLHEDVDAETDADGFRLPTRDEWELAARYKGSDSSHGAIEHPAGSGKYWTPGNYASGATDDYNNEDATKAAAWYRENSEGKTQDVGKKPEEGNGLGLFDMSGNVWELCFCVSRWAGSHRVIRGGSWHGTAASLRVGYVVSVTPCSVDYSLGLRLLRTHF